MYLRGSFIMSNSRRFYVHAHNLPFGKIDKGPQQNHSWEKFCFALDNGEVDIVHFNYAFLPQMMRERIANAIRLSSSLKELLIKGSTLNDKLDVDMKMLLDHQSLQKLCLSDFNVSTHGINSNVIEALAAMLTESDVLSSINLQYMSFAREDLTPLITAIAKSERLLELEFNTVEFSASQIDELQQAVRENKSLRRIIYLNEASEKTQSMINIQFQIAMGDKCDVPYSLIQQRSDDRVLYTKIEYVHRTLLRLTEENMRETTSPRKRNIYEMLKSELDQSSNSSKYESIMAFKKAMFVEDAAMSQHRTSKWQRYLCESFSLLNSIPALVSGSRPLAKYGTMRFLKPVSQNLISCANAEVSRLEGIVIKSH